MIDYCDAIDEMEKNPQAKEYFVKASNGNAEAYDFLWDFWCFAHCYDDLLDKEKPVPYEMGVRTFVKFFHMISYNSFYEKHKDQLYSHIISVCNRWLDGDEWEKSDNKMERIVSHVVRCGDVDLYLHVAYLTGGWDHMRHLKSLRTYDSNGIEQIEMKDAM